MRPASLPKLRSRRLLRMERLRAVQKARALFREAELYLLASPEDGECCKCREALDVASRVDEACGHVRLNLVPSEGAVAYVRGTPSFDLAGLIWAMRREVTRAASHPPGPSTRLAVEKGELLLDGKPVLLDFTTEKKEDALAFFRQVIGQRGGWISSTEIGRNEKKEGVRFDRVYRHEKLPAQVKELIESDRRKGYRLRPNNADANSP